MTTPEVREFIDACYPVKAHPRTARLFKILWAHQNQTATHEVIAEQIKAMTKSYCSENTIRTLVKELRRILAQTGWPMRLETVTRVGYRLVVQDSSWTLPR